MNINLYANRILRPIAEKKKEDIFDSIAITGMRASPGPGNISQPGPPNPPAPTIDGFSVIDNLDSEYISAGARNTDFEFTTGQNKSIAFWFNPSNITESNISSQRLITVSNTTQDQWQILYLAPDNTNGNRFRFRINGNSAGTIFFYKQTTERLMRNRWHFVTVTYGGGTAPSSINIYINGALAANTTSTGGTFVSAYSDAALRMNIGRSMVSSGTDYSAMGIAHLQFYNKVLSAGEITSLYNSGTIYSYDTNATYLTNGLHYFKLNSDYANSAGTVTLTNSGSSLSADVIDVTATGLSFRPAIYASTRYVAFGDFIEINSDLYRILIRSGTTHLANGNIVNYSVQPSAFNGSNGITANETAYVIDDATYDLRGGSCASIGGKLVLFSSRYDSGADTFIDARRYESTDGTTGSTFDAGTAMSVTLARFNFYGKPIAGFSPGEWIAPFYERSVGGLPSVVSIFKTADNGVDGWPTKITMYDTAVATGTDFALGETWIINLGSTSAGSQTLLSLSRCDNEGFRLYRMISGDGGATWSAPAQTNLADNIGESNASMCLDDDGRLDVVLTNRTALITGGVFLSKGNDVETILNNPMAFNTREMLFYAWLGYPDIVNLGGNSRMILLSTETTGADLYIGIGDIY